MSDTPSIPESYFSRRLVELREARGLSRYRLAQLATAAGYPITDAALAKLERDSRPYLETAAALAAALGVQIAELVDPDRFPQAEKKSGKNPKKMQNCG
jgi:transcriptional regulator with XRE-family HTH domain